MTATKNRHGSAVITLPSDTEIVITRQFDAPAALIFRAHTEPALIKRWWGYSEDAWNECSVDLSVGGKWRYSTNHTNDNGSFEVNFHGTYYEIDAPNTLTFSEVFEGVPGAPSPSGGDEEFGTRNTMVLTEVDGVTTMVNTCVCNDQFTRDMIIESGMEGGMQVSYDRMEDLIAAGI